MKWAMAGVAVLALALAEGACLQAANRYSVRSLGEPWWATDNQPQAINDDGQVVGADYINNRAFLWDSVNGMQDLGALPPGSTSGARGVNNRGEVVGGSELGSSAIAFLWDRVNGMQNIGDLPGGLHHSGASDINNSGQVAGWGSAATGSRAFLWDSTNGMQDLGDLPGGDDASWAYAINDDGQVVGSSRVQYDREHAFLWDNVNGMQDLGWLDAGLNSSRARDINNRGQVVGSSSVRLEFRNTSHAFLWDSVNGMQDIGDVGVGYNGSRAYGINDNGEVVGKAKADGPNFAFVWDSVNGLRNLNDLLDESAGNVEMVEGRGINNHGQIICFGGDYSGPRHGFLLTPVPDPTTLTSVANGDWSAVTTWDHGDLTPTANDSVVIAAHAVTVATDGAAFSILINDGTGKIAVGSGNTLTTVENVDIGLGKLEIAPAAAVDAGGEVTFGGSAEYECELNGPENGLITTDGNIDLHGTFTLESLGKLRQTAPGEPEWYGDETRTIITAASVSGTFTHEPQPGDHLGRGVFLTDRGEHGRAVTYDPSTVEVDVFQAADGDTNGNRRFESLDIQAILSANTFPDVQPADWPEGDFTGDGWCNGLDIQAILSTGLYPFLPGPYAAVEPGQSLDGIVDLLLDPATGSLTIDTDGVSINGYVIRTAAGIFTGQAADNLGWFVQDCDDQISGNMGMTIAGEHWLGDVIGPEWLIDVNPHEDLTFTYTIRGTPGTFVGTLIVVPEPGAVVILLTGAVAFLTCLRRRKP